MNILVTGASGFVGRVLTRELLKTGDSISVVSRDKNFKQEGVKVHYGDLRDRNFCKQILENIDIAYYLAGHKKNVSYHLKAPYEFALGNVEPLISFLEAVKESSVKKIIYLSSVDIVTYKDGEKNGYLVGKFINELLLKAFAEQSEVDVKIVRAPAIYGPGDNFDPETANFIPSIIIKVHSGEKEMTVWGKGEVERQFVYVEDLASNLIKIAESQDKLFTIGNNESFTVNKIVNMIVELSGKQVVVKNDPTKPDKATNLFEFNNLVEPKFDLKAGLVETIKFYKNTYA